MACWLTPDMRQVVDTMVVYRLNILPSGNPMVFRNGIMNVAAADSHWTVNRAAANTPVQECIEYKWPS